MVRTAFQAMLINDSTSPFCALRVRPVSAMASDDEKTERELASPEPVDDRAPHQRASFWRIAFLTWTFDIIRIAYGRHARKLVETDAFSLGVAADAQQLSESWLADFRRADAEALAYNARLVDGTAKLSWRQRLSSRLWSASGLRARDGRETPGMVHLLIRRFARRIFSTCILPLSLALAANISMSLVVRVRRYGC